jgi:hypothetical protein
LQEAYPFDNFETLKVSKTLSLMLELSTEERAMLSGELGPGVCKAMEVVVALGRIYSARRLVEVSSVQVAGNSLSLERTRHGLFSLLAAHHPTLYP